MPKEEDFKKHYSNKSNSQQDYKIWSTIMSSMKRFASLGSNAMTSIDLHADRQNKNHSILTRCATFGGMCVILNKNFFLLII